MAESATRVLSRLTLEKIMNLVIPPPAKEWRRTSVSLPVATWELLDKAMREVNVDRPSQERLSRDHLMMLFIEWADRERRAQLAASKKK
jgi:hypothetical protein